MTNLPSVNDLIKDDPPPVLDHYNTNKRRLNVLCDVIHTVSQNAGWKGVLKPDVKYMDKCWEMINANQPFKGNERLVDVLDGCIRSGNWEPLFEDGGLLRLKESSGPRRSKDIAASIIPYGFFKTAFRNDYIAPHGSQFFLETIDKYMPKNIVKEEKRYNWSFSIVQSSGMGKSRMVDNSAKLRFTFPFNLHEDMVSGSKGYPPSDRNIRDYITASFAEDSGHSVTIRHHVFLEALFLQAVEEIKGYPKDFPQAIALKWYEWMDSGSTLTEVGPNRAGFYDRVIEKAKQLEQLETKKSAEDRLSSHQMSLLKVAGTFIDCLRGLHKEEEKGFLALVYFDEAHTLLRKEGRSPYFDLMLTLNTIVARPIFFIFLSTNPSLNMFTPVNAHYPSNRVQLVGSMLIPPFFELPFDCYCIRFTEEAKKAGKLTLYGVCELEQVIKFGRPIWTAHYNALSNDMKLLVMKLARMKLGPSTKYSRLAALDCRILLRYDPLHSNSREVQENLVKSYMRVVFNIPEDRSYMWSGYPSDPMLAEAAASLLNEEAELLTHESNKDPQKEKTDKSYHLIRLVPAILNEALKDGFLARGERGELIIRTLFTIAHDLTIAKKYPTPGNEMHFHRPIRLLNLCSEECWKIMQSATPSRKFPNALTLKDAFEDAWVSFSHFVQLGDFHSFNLKFFSELLKRGAAVQACDNQPYWDGAIPLHFGNPAKTLIETKSTSALLVQGKNRKDYTKVASLLQPIYDPDSKHPIVSIIFELGVEKPSDCPPITVYTAGGDSGTVAANTRSSKENTPDLDISGRHYVITLYGCTSRTYKCIPDESSVYNMLLQAQQPSDEFPRVDSKANENAFYGLKPIMYDGPASRVPWAQL